MTNPDPFEHDDAAYVMGLLSEAERAAFESHLATCHACQERVAQLSPTAGALSAISADDLLDALSSDVAGEVAHPMPDTLLPGLLRRAGVRRRRERWIARGISGLAVASLVALVFALWPAGSTNGGGTPQALTALTDTPLHATAAVTGVSWGTRIRLDCEYGSGQGGKPGAMYALMVVAKDGSRHSLGTWTVEPGRHTKFTSGTALPHSSLKTIEITNRSGKAVLALNL
jgi:anti-sigma factor RsiW